MSRPLLTWCRHALLTVCCLVAGGLAQAEAPPQPTQVPGYYRHAVGAFEVTALYDGMIKLDTKLLKNATPQQLQQLLARLFRDNPTPTAVNTYLVNTGRQLVLVDTGAAKLFGPTLGQVPAHLRAAGYTPEQVDVVLLTHLHGDHVGGVLGADGQRLYPNATVFVAKAEADFWLSAERLAQAPQAMQPFFKAAQDSLAPYQQAGRLSTFEGEPELVPGIRAVATPGHTAGHTSYLLSSGDAKLLILGDLVHNFAVQFAKPEVAIEFDSDPRAAVRTRKRVFAQAARQHLAVAGMHLPFPGIGNVRADGADRYTYVPIDFAPYPR